MTRFAKTHCSQCGKEFGPGDHGFSHCFDHRSSKKFQHVITVKIPCGPPGGEDDYDEEVLLDCAVDGVTVRADPIRFRRPKLGTQNPWVPFVLGTLDGDGYIHVRAEDWIDDHEAELLEIARNLSGEDQ